MSDKVKPVSFKQDDMDIIEHLKINGYDKGFSYYVKRLIRDDMSKEEIPISSKENKIAKPRRNTNFNY